MDNDRMSAIRDDLSGLRQYALTLPIVYHHLYALDTGLISRDEALLAIATALAAAVQTLQTQVLDYAAHAPPAPIIMPLICEHCGRRTELAT